MNMREALGLGQMLVSLNKDNNHVQSFLCFFTGREGKTYHHT